MRLSNKFHQTLQYWIAIGIFIESRAGVNSGTNQTINIININIIRIECNVTTGTYSNEPMHTIHAFLLSVSPGYKILERLTQIIYLSIIVWSVTNLTVRIVLLLV